MPINPDPLKWTEMEASELTSRLAEKLPVWVTPRIETFPSLNMWRVHFFTRPSPRYQSGNHGRIHRRGLGYSHLGTDIKSFDIPGPSTYDYIYPKILLMLEGTGAY